MKDNFLTIPDFPNYEINSELLVRNKKTGKFLKPVLRRGNLFVGLHNGIHCKRVSRSLKYCRVLALAATAKTIFYPVPSLGGKYEISKSGVLRNAALKYALKLDKTNAYCVTIDKKNKRISRNTLLNEVFGTNKGRPRVQIVLNKNDCRIYFETASAAARFLSKIVFLGESRLRYLFTNRKTFIKGWKVNYLDH